MKLIFRIEFNYENRAIYKKEKSRFQSRIISEFVWISDFSKKSKNNEND